MKIEVEKQELMNQILTALKAVPNKSSMEILGCVAIFAQNAAVKMAANNLELGIECFVDAAVLEEGSAAVNARFFAEMIRRLPDSTVTLLTEGESKLRVLCEEVDISMPYLSTEEFPLLPQVEADNCMAVSQYALKEMIQQTSFCVAENESRVSMTGELLKCSENRIQLAALDGFRLAVREIQMNQKIPERSVIIPGRTLIELSKILSDHLEDQVSIYTTQKHILFQMSSARIVSRLVEGEFYAIEKLTAMEYPYRMKINRRRFIESLERTLLLIREAEKKPVVFELEEQSLRIRVSSSNGTIHEKLRAAQEGSNLKIAFNPRYLLDALRAIEQEEVIVYYNTGRTPCVIRDEANTYLYLISPVSYEG